MTEPWWRGAVIYQVYPRSFADGNGDGIGDLTGLLSRLDYIAQLGVDAVWLSPIFPSPNKDFGYDVADYCAIAPEQGDMALFDQMVAECHRRGLKVILDLVLAHTSDRHPWFIESRENPQGPKGDWYVWADARADGSPPNNWLSVFGGAGWSWCPVRRQYWHHKFLREQPKLNLWNPDCRAAVLDVFRFWIARGVDGFRLDVANSYLHDPALRDNPPLGQRDQRGRVRYHPPQMQRHVRCSNLPENAGVLRDIRALADETPEVFVFGEFSEEPEMISLFAGGADVLHSGYTFTFLEDRSFAPEKFKQHFEFLGLHPGVWPAITFSNHDTVRPVTRWGKDREPAGLAKLALTLLMCLRGTALLYQGEELGLPEAQIPPGQVRDPVGLIYAPYAQGRDGCRTPMPWESAAAGMGFSGANSWLPLAPEHRALAVDRQAGDKGSSLAHARKVIAARKNSAALKGGAIRFLDLPPPLLGFTRGEGDDRVGCIFNLSGNEEARLPINQPGMALGLELAGAMARDGHLHLPPLGAYVAVGMEVVF